MGSRRAPLKGERCDAPPESSPFAGDVSRRQECPLRPASTCWPHAARSISRVHPPPHDRVPIEALLAEASAATRSIKAERDGLAAAARQAMLCRATRRSSNSRRIGRARRPLHASICTERLRRVAKPFTQPDRMARTAPGLPTRRQEGANPLIQASRNTTQQMRPPSPETQSHALPRAPSLSLS